MSAVAAALVVAAGTVAGCGQRQHFYFGLDHTIPVTLTDYRIAPQNIVVNGGQVHLVVRNTGILPHNLVIEQFRTPRGAVPHVYGKSPTIHGGQTATEREPIFLRPGIYRMRCALANHDDLGQWGTLKVVP